MSSAFHSVRSRTRWLLIPRAISELPCLNNHRQIGLLFGELTATERNYLDTALNEPVRQGLHTAEGPEPEEKQCIGEPGNTKKQRQDRTPQMFNSHPLGDASKYTHPGSETIEKERVLLPL